jgi:hypothetical protein
MGKRRFQQLLQCLLGMEADEVVGHLGTIGELLERDLIAAALSANPAAL